MYLIFNWKNTWSKYVFRGRMRKTGYDYSRNILKKINMTLTNIDRKLLKVMPFSTYEMEYLPYKSKSDKERYIKKIREEKREIERLDNITCSLFA